MKQTVQKLVILLIILIAGCGTDYASKQWAVGGLKGEGTHVLIPNIVEMTYVENRGMVFGLLNDAERSWFDIFLVWMRVVIALGVAAYIVFNRRRPLLFLVPFVLILAGAGGNIYDNFATGYVIDFLHLHFFTLLDWPFLFNVADVYIFLGMVYILGIGFFKKDML